MMRELDVELRAVIDRAAAPVTFEEISMRVTPSRTHSPGLRLLVGCAVVLVLAVTTFAISRSGTDDAAQNTFGYPIRDLRAAAKEIARSEGLSRYHAQVTRTTWARANAVAFPTTNNPNIAPTEQVWVFRLRGQCARCTDAKGRKRTLTALAVAEVNHLAFRFGASGFDEPTLDALGRVATLR